MKDRDEYYYGRPGKKYGIYNSCAKKFQFGICEDTPFLAYARLTAKIGDNARKWRFEPKILPEEKIPKKQTKQPTIAILTDDGNLYCDACGFGLNRGFKFCPNCGREIDWNK